MFWGLTPALNFFDEIEGFEAPSNRDLNILLVGGADCRHVLKTAAKCYRHPGITVNFYLMEACPETVAKQMLLLYVATQPDSEFGVAQRARYFMELYGNAVIRPTVAKYLRMTSKGFLDLITDYENLRGVIPFMSLNLRHKERDYLENVFKFWSGSDEFEICEIWNKRVRKALGVRYDSRKGAFDWDLHMRFHNVGGSIVGNQEYQSFRNRGIAFSWIESEVSKPNRSMVCGLLPNGDNFIHYGYMGDISTGPYVAYGLHCRDKDMLKKTNNLHQYRSTDVTEWNLKEIFHEIHNSYEYVHRKLSDLNLGPSSAELNQSKVVDSSNSNDDVTRSNLKRCIDLPGVRVTFQSLNFLPTYRHKESYHDLFDVVYFNFNYLKHLEARVIEKIAKVSSLLYVENQMFVLNFREKDLEAFKVEVEAKLHGLKYEPLNFDAAKDHTFKLRVNC